MSPSPIHRCLSTTGFLLLLSIVAIAAVESAHAQSTTLPQVVIYANQAPTEFARVGASVTVMTGENLRAKGITSVPDALRLVPGVAVGQSGARGSLTQVRIRGAEANHLLVLIDGVQVNDVSEGDFNFADLSIEDVERIEVIRGPQSGLYGANAHAGVISIVTRSGRGLRKPEFNAKIEGGTQRTGKASASLRAAAGPFYGAFTVSDYSTAGHNVSRFGTERDGSRAFTMTAKGGIDFTRGVNVEASFRSVNRFAYTDSQPYFGPFIGLATDQPADFNAFKGYAARIAGTWSLFNGALTQRVSASRYQQNRHDDDVVNGFFKANGARETFDYKATLRADSNLIGGEQHTLTILTDKQKEFLSTASAFYDAASAAFWAAGARRERTGLAGEYSIDLPFGLTVTGALRHDWNLAFADATTWRVTAAQRIASTHSRLHGGIGTGITNPTFTEQFGFFPGQFIGNPTLKPERSLGWDIGIEQSFLDGRLVTDVTYFGSDFVDKIVQVSAGGGFLSTVVNAPGTSPRRGIEVVVKAAPASWLLLNASYTYTMAKLADGRPETRRPKHAASGSATVRFADGRGRATFNVIYNGKMQDTWFTFPLTPVTLDSYTTVGGVISYDVTPWATAYLRGENIFNNRYEEVFSYRAAGAAVYAGLKLRLSE